MDCHDETMALLFQFYTVLDHLQNTAIAEGLRRFERSIELMVYERDRKLERDVREALGKHGVATNDWGPLNRFCEMI